MSCVLRVLARGRVASQAQHGASKPQAFACAKLQRFLGDAVLHFPTSYSLVRAVIKCKQFTLAFGLALIYSMAWYAPFGYIVTLSSLRIHVFNIHG